MPCILSGQNFAPELGFYGFGKLGKWDEEQSIMDIKYAIIGGTMPGIQVNDPPLILKVIANFANHFFRLVFWTASFDLFKKPTKMLSLLQWQTNKAKDTDGQVIFLWLFGHVIKIANVSFICFLYLKVNMFRGLNWKETIVQIR